jgi:hypothetical protein
MAKNLCDSCVQKTIEECDAMYHEVQFFKDLKGKVPIEDMKKVHKCFKYEKSE